MKKFIAILLVICSISVTAFADNSIKVTIDGNLIEFDVNPTMVNDRVLVPMRKIFETMGAEVEWASETQTIFAKKDDINIEMQIDNLIIKVNEEIITLDVPPMLIESRTLVPVRAVAESLNTTVNWDGENNTVIIKSLNLNEIRSKVRYHFEQDLLPTALLENKALISSDLSAGNLDAICNYVVEVWNSAVKQVVSDYSDASEEEYIFETQEQLNAFLTQKNVEFGLYPEENFEFLLVEDGETNDIVIKMTKLPDINISTYLGISYNTKKDLIYFTLEKNAGSNFSFCTIINGSKTSYPDFPNNMDEFIAGIEYIMNE